MWANTLIYSLNRQGNMPANNSRDTLLRQWKLLQIIPREPAAINSREAYNKLRAEGYTVGRRTVERDMQKLVDAGFPLWVDETAEPYLWSWSRSAPAFFLPLPSVTDSLLLVMVQDNLKAILPPAVVAVLAPYVARAEAVLAESGQHNQLAHWKDKVRVVPPTQPLIAPEVDEAARNTVCESLLQETQVQVKYAGMAKGRSADLLLNPHALLQRGPVTYLMATCADYLDMRHYALHRVRQATNTYAPMKRLPGFNLDEQLKQGFADFGGGAMKDLDVLIDKGLAAHLSECRLTKGQTIEAVAEPEGWFRLRARLPDTPQLTWWLRGFGNQVRQREV